MTISEIQNIISETFNELGIYISTEEIQGNISDFDFGEYFVDSMQYITFIVTLESKLDISIPDELLIIDNFKSIVAFTNMLKTIMNN